jgi:hypothetical protein
MRTCQNVVLYVRCLCCAWWSVMVVRWDGSTGRGMTDGGYCRYVVVFFNVSVWQPVVLCCISFTQKWWLTLDKRSGWSSGLARGYKMWQYTILLDLPFMSFVLLAWGWLYEVETCCQIKDITLTRCFYGNLFLLLWDICKKFSWQPRPGCCYFSAFLQN